MQITEQEIREAVGHPVIIEEGQHGDGVRYFEFTGAPNHGLWVYPTEDEAKAALLAEIAMRATDKRTVRFRVWPDTKSRADGKASGYARACFS